MTRKNLRLHAPLCRRDALLGLDLDVVLEGPDVVPIVDPLCTLTLSRRLDPDRQLSHRLGDLCARYGIELVRPHDALADADATAALLPHLLKAHGITSAAQLSVAS